MKQHVVLQARNEPGAGAFRNKGSVDAGGIGRCERWHSGAAAGETGIAIRLVPQPGAGASERVEIVLAHADRQSDIVLYAADHADDVIAEWQAWGARLLLPLMLEDADGVRTTVVPQLGAVRIGAPRPRRSKAILSGRRPRFLTRRKTGSMPQRPKVLRGAREIIARS
jgi:hypothetical protein